ncbi:MAG TPA: hypothetical protein PK014_06015 [Thermoanaerobaculia bacterium]|nr:hypothetical protein [Thermoanaerobaculia bacterium]HUM29652.1 hypothetical protein [Thermoanaerobaculia bacterium]HXK67303.1 hypothetical protein [Thermoanaerobaculia bacterium]
MVTTQQIQAAARVIAYSSVFGELMDLYRTNTANSRNRIPTVREVDPILSPVIEGWSSCLPPLPRIPFGRTSIWREGMRGLKDTYLKNQLYQILRDSESGRNVIVNPISVFGRHSRDLARALPACEVISTDITSTWNTIFRHTSARLFRATPNYRFVRESIYDPDVTRRPEAVVFFGACGSLTDASIDYAVTVESPILAARTCCLENIAGNTKMVKHWTLINILFRMKNWEFSRYKKTGKDYYFSPFYNVNAYPRSQFARMTSNSDEFLRIAQDAVDNPLCRELINIDRCLHLEEHGYNVLYRQELFFAFKESEKGTAT